MHNLATYIIKMLINNWHITLSILIVIAILLIYIISRSNIRITCIQQLPPKYVNTKLTGIVTSVSDGDGFRFFHTPLLRSSNYKKGDQTLQIRLAGIDAPEMRNFNRPAQPFSSEARDYLRKLILNKSVKVKILGIDHYNRIIGTVFVSINRKNVNVSTEMVKVGLACVYYGTNALYDDYKQMLDRYEKKARNGKMGMWNQANYVSPMDYKKIIKA